MSLPIPQTKTLLHKKEMFDLSTAFDQVEVTALRNFSKPYRDEVSTQDDSEKKLVVLGLLFLDFEYFPFDHCSLKLLSYEIGSRRLYAPA